MFWINHPGYSFVRSGFWPLRNSPDNMPSSNQFIGFCLVYDMSNSHGSCTVTSDISFILLAACFDKFSTNLVAQRLVIYIGKSIAFGNSYTIMCYCWCSVVFLLITTFNIWTHIVVLTALYNIVVPANTRAVSSS